MRWLCLPGRGQSLGSQRDADATTIKNDLNAAEFGSGLPATEEASDLSSCKTDLSDADLLAASVSPPETVQDSPFYWPHALEPQVAPRAPVRPVVAFRVG